MNRDLQNRPDRILATGADGKFAGLVIPELANRGAHVRGLLRKPDKADQVRQSGAAEIAIGGRSFSVLRASGKVDFVHELHYPGTATNRALFDLEKITFHSR